jgi:ferredoxin
MSYDPSLEKSDINTAGSVPEIHPAFVELARLFSSVKIMGPPMSDKLVELISHLFSPEEAEICKGLTFWHPRSAETISHLCKRDKNDVLPMLKSMGQRRVINESQGKFMLYPLIPGVFEYIFMTGRNTPWHKKYAELFNDIFGTGYIAEYLTRELDAIRNIPIQHTIENKNYVVDADLMSNMLDAHNHFAVINYCPCRHSKKLIGHNCKRATPEDGCLVIGNFSKVTVSNGNGRAVSKAAMRDIVAERWEKKLVFLTANVDPALQNIICTCCDCCCHALQTINHFSNNFLAAPHYIVQVDDSLCINCGKCAHVCNTHAHAVADKLHHYTKEKCIGCGNCIDVCKKEAIKLVENPLFRKPANGYIKLLLKMMPSITMMGIKIKLSRYLDKNK